MANEKTLHSPGNNQNQDENQPTTQQVPGSGQSGVITPGQPAQTGVAAGGPRTAQFSTGRQPGSSGGRFTNIKKYIEANQGAGQRLASGIQSKLGSEFEKQKTQAGSQAEAVKTGIEQAKGTLERGAGYEGSLKQPGFDVNTFLTQPVTQNQPAPDLNMFSTTDRKTFEDLTNKTDKTDQDKATLDALNRKYQTIGDVAAFRTGSAVDERALQEKTNEAALKALETRRLAQEREAQAASESGRFGLLKETFGGTGIRSGYTTGQQKLDNLFLQASRDNALGKLQENLRSNLGQAKQLDQTVQDYEKSLQTDVVQREADLAKNIAEATKALETGFVTGIETDQARIDQVNKERADKVARYRGEYEEFLKGNPVSQEFLDAIGIGEGQSTFNILNERPSLESLFRINDERLAKADQLASAEERARYDALARLAGLQNEQFAIGAENKTPEVLVANDMLRTRREEEQARLEEFLKSEDAKMRVNAATLSQGRTDTGGFNFAPDTATAEITDYNAALKGLSQIPIDLLRTLNQARKANEYSGGSDFIANNLDKYLPPDQMQKFLDVMKNSTTLGGREASYDWVKNQPYYAGSGGVRTDSLLRLFDRLDSLGYFNQARVKR